MGEIGTRSGWGCGKGKGSGGGVAGRGEEGGRGINLLTIRTITTFVFSKAAICIKLEGLRFSEILFFVGVSAIISPWGGGAGDEAVASNHLELNLVQFLSFVGGGGGGNLYSPCGPFGDPYRPTPLQIQFVCVSVFDH